MNDSRPSNIKPFPKTKRRMSPDGQFLVPVHDGRACRHDVGYIVDEAEAEVACEGCHAKLNPIWVLGQMAIKETGWHRSYKYYLEAMRRLQERSRTKCQHCGKLTRISER